jgi:hypothetical protein
VRWEDCEFEASLGLSQKQTNKKKQKSNKSVAVWWEVNKECQNDKKNLSLGEENERKEERQKSTFATSWN